MAGIKHSVYRGKYLLSSTLDLAYAWGAGWCRDGWQLPRENVDRRAANRLRKLIERFRLRELCAGQEYAAFAADSGAELSSLPILDKRGLKALFPELEKRYARRSDVYSTSTGGSTGEPVALMRSRILDRRCAGAFLVVHQLLGWRPGMQRICLWGSERDIGKAEENKGWLSRLFNDMIIVGAYAPNEKEYREFVDLVCRHPGCAVYGFTSLLTECSRLTLEQGWHVPAGTVSAAWVGAEALGAEQRSLFQQAFGIELRDHYGSRECDSIAVECPAGVRHVNPRFVLEVVDPETHAAMADGDVGSLLVTDLFNDVTPLIRYEIGDLGSIQWQECACGRRGQCLTSLAGRIAEMFTLPSGKRISALFFNHLLKEFQAIHQFQVLRQADLSFALLYSGAELEQADRGRVIAVTQQLLEGAQVSIKRVEQLDRSPSGKLIQYRDIRPPAGG